MEGEGNEGSISSSEGDRGTAGRRCKGMGEEGVRVVPKSVWAGGGESNGRDDGGEVGERRAKKWGRGRRQDRRRRSGSDQARGREEGGLVRWRRRGQIGGRSMWRMDISDGGEVIDGSCRDEFECVHVNWGIAEHK